MLVTAHWSATSPVRLRKYHIEFAITGSAFSSDVLHNLRALGAQANGYQSVPWSDLLASFTIWKNEDLTAPDNYGTWDMNTDPRDGSSNIEVSAMCMLNAKSNAFGQYPYTMAHAWIHAGILARVCALKGLDATESFDASVEPGTLQNGPIFTVSTHGERAIQTVDYGVPNGNASSQAASDQFGYFLGSGDPDSRWDIALLDPEYIPNGVTIAGAKAAAAWLRQQTHAIKAAGIADYWGIDGGDTP
jgi:hypothetical protein